MSAEQKPTPAESFDTSVDASKTPSQPDGSTAETSQANAANPKADMKPQRMDYARDDAPIRYVEGTEE